MARRRFTVWVAVGWAAITLPFLWVLTDEWNSGPSLLRTVLPNGRLGNLYDLQARAIMSGHLYVPKGALGLEAFVHDGHQYTYFGLFPSLIRIPILLVTHRLDGRLSAISLLIAWIVAGSVSALLLWRVRVLDHGELCSTWNSRDRQLRRSDGDDPRRIDASQPCVRSLDLHRGHCLGHRVDAWKLVRPGGRARSPELETRVVLAGVFILATELTRGSAGVGCVVAAVAIAGWFLIDRSRVERRRWWWPVLLAGVVPLIVSFAVSWMKFGVLTGYPLHDQLYFRSYLSHIPGSYFSLKFLPTTLVTYVLGPGLHVSGSFPFLTLPAYPASSVGSVHLFGTEEVTTLVGSMPLLFLASLWGVVAVLRPKAFGGARLLALPLLGAAATAGVILIFGFLDERFLGDFIPFLVLASCAGLVDLWHRLEGSRGTRRVLTFGCVALFGLWSVVATLGISVTPTGWWSNAQTHRFVETQKSVDDALGIKFGAGVMRGTKLPTSAPLGQLFILGDCESLLIRPSAGIRTWLPVEPGPMGKNSICRGLQLKK